MLLALTISHVNVLPSNPSFTMWLEWFSKPKSKSISCLKPFRLFIIYRIKLKLFNIVHKVYHNLALSTLSPFLPFQFSICSALLSPYISIWQNCLPEKLFLIKVQFSHAPFRSLLTLNWSVTPSWCCLYIWYVSLFLHIQHMYLSCIWFYPLQPTQVHSSSNSLPSFCIICVSLISELFLWSHKHCVKSLNLKKSLLQSHTVL